jgi:ornithine carbamoyltransferase|tara:strand:- start:1723 stop:2751 length:1029 start_codon:yes stop_codon:yes gene_type:complete
MTAALTREHVRSLGLTARDFLCELDFTSAQLNSVLDLAVQLKQLRKEHNEPELLLHKNLAAIFEKTSTRTRISFSVAMNDQGGNTTFLDGSSSQIGHKESPADTARVLSRLFDAIEFRGSDQAVVEELAQHSQVPVYNGLTDQWHPTQMLADFLTMREHQNEPGEQISYCYLGDARNNMGNSLLIMGAIMGSDTRIVAPKALWPEQSVIDQAQERARDSGAQLTITEDVAQGVAGAEFVHTDVWVSMGEPKEVWQERIELLKPYQVNQAVLDMAGPHSKAMHCLPAYHDSKTAVGAQISQEFNLDGGVEITHEVFESKANISFDQAENRMHTIKSLLVATLA